MNKLKEFWKYNKTNYLISLGIIFFFSFLILTIKKIPMENLFLIMNIQAPMVFLMGFGIFCFLGGGDK